MFVFWGFFVIFFVIQTEFNIIGSTHPSTCFDFLEDIATGILFLLLIFMLPVCHKALHPESGLPDIVPGAFSFYN